MVKILAAVSTVGVTAVAAAAGPRLQPAGSSALSPNPNPNLGSVEFAVGDACLKSIADTVAAVQASGCAVRTKVNTPLYCGLSFGCPFSTSASSVVAALKTPVVNTYNVNKRLGPKTVKDAVRPEAAPVEQIHVLTGVNDARNKLGLTGKGVKVAILDTGVYYKHPALGGCFGPGCKVAFGYDLVGDTYGAADPTIVPDSDPLDDCSEISHGTHVAGIVGGNALNITTPGFIPGFPWTGVAPDVTLGAYRIFGCPADNTYDDVISAAIYQAAADGADIINLSLGGGPTFADQADGVAVTRVSAAGVIVTASNGNDGSSGYMTNGNPGGAIGGFGVASFDNLATPQFTLTVGGLQFPWIGGTINSSFQTPSETLDIFINNPDAVKNDVQDDGCTSVGSGAAGKTVLLRWGTFCGSVSRCSTAMRAGAKNCLIYSNGDSIIQVTGGSIPTASTSKEAGAAILASSTDVVISKDFQQFPLATGGTVSSFSSPGLDSELHIKPDIGGIGGNVYSTISPHAAAARGLNVPYASYSGTSMASPYFAGTVALYLQAKGKTSFDSVKTAFQTTATPTKIYQSDLVASVAQQGAGLVNVYNALIAKTVVTPSSLALNDTQFTSKTHYTLSLTNNYATPVSYLVVNVGAATVNMFNGVEDFIQNAAGTTLTSNYASIGFGNKQDAAFTTVVAAGASTQINVKVTVPSGDPTVFPIFSGYIKITNNVDDTVINVPYAGMVGSWSNSPIFSVNALSSFGYSSGMYTVDGFPIQSGSTFNFSTTGIIVAPIYATTTRLTYVEVIFANNSQAVKNQLNNLGLGHGSNQGYAYLSSSATGRPDFLPYGVGPRNAVASGQSVSTPWIEFWRGYVLADPNTTGPIIRLPAGDYKLRLKGMLHMTPGRYLADDNYQIIETPFFKIVY
ncbi:peptidase S8/S53 domain-containing protein [Zopfochytrium polystomum]|nr:peptidase S8/S53 domain-containing protein [Zopfochytrium polystomum]